MRIMKGLLPVMFFLFLFGHLGFGQTDDTDKVYEPYFRTYFSFGAGISLAGALPSDIYQDGHSNVQIGLLFERTLSPRFSAVSGIEIEQNAYNFDGEVGPAPEEDVLRISRAGDNIKYTRLVQRNLSIPLQVRFYYKPNLGKFKSNAYLQGGIRISANGTTTFSYRKSNTAFSEDVKPFANVFNIQGEMMIGFKGDFFRRFDLLNASSIGVIYQFTEMFQDGSNQNIRPIHFTWRFIF